MGVMSGCGWWGEDPTDPDPDPLEPLLTSVRSLAAGHEAAVAAHPDLAARLDPLRETHRAHEHALLTAIGRADLATPPSDAGHWAPPTDDRSTPEEVLASLGEAERAGWVEAREACLSAPPERVALLGSIAAARATHGEVLA